MQSFTELGIELRGNKTQQKVRCPRCIKLGKENWRDTCLSINLDHGIYHCHKCGWKGRTKQDKSFMKESKTYRKPNKANMKKLTAQGKKFLKSRGITDEVIEKNKIVSTKDNRNIVFPYMQDGEIKNYKTRGIDGKFFTDRKSVV